MLPLSRAEAAPYRPSWHFARQDADMPPRHPALGPAAAPFFAVGIHARRPRDPGFFAALASVPREPAAPAPAAKASAAAPTPLAHVLRAPCAGSDRSSLGTSPPPPVRPHGFVLNPRAEAFLPRGQTPVPPPAPDALPAPAAPLAPLEATVAFGLLVARAPRGSEAAADGTWPRGFNGAHRLFLRTRVSEGGTRLPPDHTDLTQASFPPPWRRIGRRWSSFARSVSRLDSATFARAAELLASAQRPDDNDALAVHWAWGSSRSLARRRGLRHHVVQQATAQAAGETMLHLSAQVYVFATEGVGALPPLQSTDEDLPPALVPDLVAPQAWALDAAVLLNGERRARPGAHRPRG